MIDSENSQDNKNVLSEFLKDPTDKLLGKKYFNIRTYTCICKILAATSVHNNYAVICIFKNRKFILEYI